MSDNEEENANPNPGVDATFDFNVGCLIKHAEDLITLSGTRQDHRITDELEKFFKQLSECLPNAAHLSTARVAKLNETIPLLRTAWLDGAQRPASPAPQVHQVNVQAPRYPYFVRDEDVPKFDGLASSWRLFKSLFTEVVSDNPNLKDESKLYKLILAVPERFKETVRSCETWNRAMRSLSDTFEDPRALRTELYQSLSNAPNLSDRPSLTELHNYLDTVYAAQRRASPYGSVMEDQSHTILAKKLGKHYPWYMNRPKHDDIDDLIVYLKERIQTYEDIEKHNAVIMSSVSYVPNTSNRNYIAPRPQQLAITAAAAVGGQPGQHEPCVFCGGSHMRKFCSWSRPAKRDALKRQNRCFGCFAEFVRGQSHQCKVRCSACARARMNFLVCLCQEPNASSSASSQQQPQPRGPPGGSSSGSNANLYRPSTSRGPSSNQPSSGNQRNGGSSQSQSTQHTNSIQVEEAVPIVSPNHQVSTIVRVAHISQVAKEETVFGIAKDGTVYLPTLKVYAKRHDNNLSTVSRTMLDSGSSASFASEALISQLGMTKDQIAPMTVKAFGGLAYLQINYTCRLMLQSKVDPSVQSDVVVYVMPGILIGKLPAPDKQMIEVAQKHNIVLSDCVTGKDAEPIDMIIGQDLFNEHFLLDLQKSIRPKKGLAFVETRFGWVLQGTAGGGVTNQYANCAYVSLGPPPEPNLIGYVNFTQVECICQDLSRLLLDPLSDPKSEELVNNWGEKFRNLLIYDPSQRRYIVPLPWYDDETRPSPNYRAALAQCFALRNRLIDKGQYDEYYQAMQDLIQQGYAEVVRVFDPDDGYFLPHFPVIKISSETTPLRAVFNASSAAKGKKSLNDCVFKGIWAQANLVQILLRWRTNPLVILADLKKAFLQIKIREEDRKYLRFVWFNKDRPQVYQMSSVLFGAASSPFILYAVIRHLFETFAPDLVSFLDDLYMDDSLLAADSIEQLRILIDRISAVLERASFTLHKWTALPDVAKELDIEPKTGKASCLGVGWDLDTDSIVYDVPKLPTGDWTRRTLASALARNFDPMGLLGPAHTRFKLLLREVILQNKDWDTKLSPELCAQAQELVNDFIFIKKITFPRCVKTSCDFELWIFGDASKFAYGVCAYVYDKTSEQVHLLLSRGHLASTKSLTIPQLELTAATLLANTYEFIQKSMKGKIPKLRFFTDSTITLSRINSNQNRLDKYVSSRVAKITELTSTDDWYHIPTESNPADIISRGITLQRLSIEKLWFNGPPVDIIMESVARTEILRRKKDYAICLASQVLDHDELMERLFTGMSYHTIKWFFKRLLRHMNHYVDLVKRRLELYGQKVHLDYLAEVLLWIKIQEFTLRDELVYIRKSEPIPSTSPLHNHQLYVDDYGLVRMKQRLDNSDLAYEVKFPLVLVDHAITRSYVKYVHTNFARHSGTPNTTFLVSQTVHIPNLDRIVRQVTKNCMTCRRLRNGKPFAPQVAPLPSDRVTTGRAFEVVGTDVFGPLKDTKNRNTKFYVLMFVCPKSRAVHLEVIDSRDATSIMAAFINFFGIYGVPRRIRSDNAKEFEKMAKTFKFIYDRYRETVHKLKEQYGATIEWIFSPPRAPWFGGFWERLIQSVKRGIDRIRFAESTTYAQLTTMFREVQLFMNSRPLLRKNGTILTPGHLMFAKELTHLPPIRFPLTGKDDTLIEYTLLQQSMDAFWHAWTAEYLPQLRHHWIKPSEAPKQGEMVIIKDDNLPRFYWELGHITQLITGKDGKIRTARVQLVTGEVRLRAVHKLIPLERDPAGEDVVVPPTETLAPDYFDTHGLHGAIATQASL